MGKSRKEKKKGIVYKERSKRLSAINVYITNVSSEAIPTDQVHAFYSLRWQIELLFKTWKSFFQIDQCKEIKQERDVESNMGQVEFAFLQKKQPASCGSAHPVLVGREKSLFRITKQTVRFVRMK
jgi:hypothetical protein